MGDITAEMQKQLAGLPAAQWTAKDGKLVAIVEGDEMELTFEREDPLTEALLLLLNNHMLFLSALRNP